MCEGESERHGERLRGCERGWKRSNYPKKYFCELSANVCYILTRSLNEVKGGLTEGKIDIILRGLAQEALAHRPTPTYPKIGTIKALVDLGVGWHDYREVQRELSKKFKTGNVYVFSLARQYPDLIEVNSDRQVRISPSALPVVKKVINSYAKQILHAVSLITT